MNDLSITNSSDMGLRLEYEQLISNETVRRAVMAVKVMLEIERRQQENLRAAAQSYNDMMQTDGEEE